MTDTLDQQSHDDIVASMTGGMLLGGAVSGGTVLGRTVSGDLPPFAGTERLHPNGRPRGEFRSELRKIDDARNAISSLAMLIGPILTIAAVLIIDHWLVMVAAFPVMAGWQNRMYILHHEAAHRLLFTNRKLNDSVGINVLGWLPFGTGTHGYRRGHANHHRDEFGPKEPDFLLYSFYPISRTSAVRKLRRDATGVSAFRIIKPLLTGLFSRENLPLSLRFLAGQVLVFGLFVIAGAPLLYVVLWLLPYLTLYQVYNRLRSVAEHGGMTRSDDRRKTTHHVQQSWLARATFAPYNVGYHLAHHVDSGVPFRNLPKLQATLTDSGYVTEDVTWPNYRSLWKALIKSD